MMPLDRVFQEHDLSHKGYLAFEDFAQMNEFIGLAINKKELKHIFDIIAPETANGVPRKVKIENIKGITSMLMQGGKEDSLLNEEEDENAHLTPDQMKLRQELDDIYELLKDRLEKKNVTLETIIYE